jgi:hypothetical protein
MAVRLGKICSVGRPTDRPTERPSGQIEFLLVYFSLTHAHTQDSEVMSIIRLIAGTRPS